MLENTTVTLPLADVDTLMNCEYNSAKSESLLRIGKGYGFERIRRITGYLVGTLERWNDAKYAENRDRVKHLKLYQNGGKDEIDT